MLSISVKTNIDAVIRDLQATQDEITKATVRAINRTADGAKTRMTRAISEEFRLNQSFVRERLKISRATRSKPFEISATLSGGNGSKRSMNVIHFAVAKLNRSERSAWMKQSSMQLRKGGRAMSNPQLPLQIKRSGGRVYIKGAFVGNDGRTVFRRVGASRLPIEPVQTISVPQMFNATRNVGKVKQWISDNFDRIFAAELKFSIGQRKA